MSGAVAQTKVGRARHSVRAAVCNRFSERRARSDAPYLSKGVQAVSHGVSRGEKFVVAKSPAKGGRVPTQENFLSPLTRLRFLTRSNPRLTPWATLCRCSAAI